MSLKAEGLGKRYGRSLFRRGLFSGAQSSSGHVVFEDVSFELKKGRTFGLMGPSGTGKSTLGRVLAGLERPTVGRVLYNETPLSGLSRKEYPLFRRKVQVMFQDPLASLNPQKKIIKSVLEVLDLLEASSSPFSLQAGERDRIVQVMLDSVGLRSDVLFRYPRQLSGGQNQRIALGRILLLEPEFIILDEPTSALDVSVQAQILHLLKDLQSKRGIGYLFISHDEEVVRFMSDEVGLLKGGTLSLLER